MVHIMPNAYRLYDRAAARLSLGVLASEVNGDESPN